MTEHTVSKYISQLDNNFKPGPDGIPANILKSCPESLSSILAHLFNLSLRSGYFPNVWKTSYAIPIHKNGKKEIVTNYRNVSKLSVIPKLFEEILLSCVFFYSKSLINNNQHGFMPGRSTETNLVKFTSYCIKAIENKAQVDCIFTDFSKAFDRISHNLLLYKLNLMGFPPTFLKWIESYLKNRKQKVIFLNHESEDILVTSGVPQGSHLGPFLFILFINDVTLVIKHSEILIYADDIKIFRVIRNSNDAKLLQEDLESFYQWTKDNLLFLNIEKCKSMSFSRKTQPVVYHYYIDGNALSTVTSTKDLGIFLDPKLEFNFHLNYIISKAHRMLGFIKRWTRDFTDPFVLKTLYISYVRSILEYASVVWAPSYDCHIERIESVQRKFLRYALRKLPWLNPQNLPLYENRLQLISLSTLHNRRCVYQIMFATKILLGITDAPDILADMCINVFPKPLRFNNNNEFLFIDFHRTNYGRNEPITAASKLFNLNYKFIDFNKNAYEIKRILLMENLIN